ncbi:condensation domain-containing protein, partial [Streptomyces pacificus]|uniref:condensation domain-containing protein n=1 Tax=Streptomyces pacificus TaxID=2705029 RepID=UPI0020B16C2E
MDGNRTAQDPQARRPTGGRGPAGALRRRPQERGPLSYGQQRLWFLDRWLDGSPVYHVPVTLRFTGRVSVERLGLALAAVAARHDVLFTVIEEEAGVPRQRLLDNRRLDCPVWDWRSEPSPEGASFRAQTAIREDALRPFDLSAGPMVRAAIHRIGAAETWLHLTFHHIAFDGWSLDVFQGQLLEAYENGGRAAGPLPVQYADYALWQRETLEGPDTEAGLARWSEALGSAPPVLDIGADRARPAEFSYRGATTAFPLTDVPLAALERFAAEENASLYMVLLAAFQLLAGRHSGTDDVVLGSPVAGRGTSRLGELVGFFADSLVLRIDLSGDPSFREVLSRARGCVLDALSRSRVPFDVAVDHLHPERSLSYSPVVQVVFALHEEERTATLGGGVTVERAMVPTGTAKFDLTWSVYRGDGGLRLEVEYATDLFEPESVRTLVDHWKTLLASAVAEPDVPAGRLAMASPAERGVLGEWGGGGELFGVGTVHGVVAARAAECPDAVAVSCGG